MESSIRKPFQGVINIIRFNWHFYAFAASIVLFVFLIEHYFISLGVTGDIFVLTIVWSTIISLAGSCYIYDFSDLYKLSWLNHLVTGKNEKIININAGFDETSILLNSKFKNSELFVADFYDSARHTEISIKRARKAYPPFPKTQQVSTTHLPIQDNSADKIFIILSAHEIRNEEERVVFFKELHRVLKSNGRIIVTEHLRNTANFLVYNIGFFHFYSKEAWRRTFRSSGFQTVEEIKITPFITTFILEKNGTAT
ncbi:methyltransferase domain-containing protein [Flavisolibacter ginsengisoli]|jgi:ubiquinone/menaquinone biosynthesis C-methylase UbiE|uniref:Methyltransferase domain-containing protein n=1 Tax=Flavisolibacter ginsengisoli DSM 18119 TaxID=1121884 RepID=A0A1M5FIR1_9BACT|nr:methyltransferase domain-containing protein [Flavisolibacter ginsengisoli]SHF91385.1 Methyltransferase domain-containing protein [Flavisolibacter ginsengisoli DSM 18119]